MIKNYEHFIITRFNVAVAYECENRNGNIKLFETILDNKYLLKRFELFEQYTIPCIKSQTNKNFKWLVLFNMDTSEYFKKKIEKYQIEIKEFEPLFILQNEEVNKYLSRYIEKNVMSQWVVTTRLDNDDVIHKTYIQNIQSKINLINKPSIISYSKGMKYDLQDNLYSLHIYKSNHFLTLVTLKNINNNHIYFQDHGKILNSDIAIIVDKTKKPMWVEIIHETNFINGPIYSLCGANIFYKEIKDYTFLNKNLINFYQKKIMYICKVLLRKLNNSIP